MSGDNDIDFVSWFFAITLGLPMIWFCILIIQFLVSMIGFKLGYDIPIYRLPWEEPMGKG